MPGPDKEERVAFRTIGHPLGVHGLPHGHIMVGVLHVEGLVCGGLEFGATSHGDMGVGVMVVHACPSSDLVHCLEEVVQEGLVGEVRVVIGVHHANNEGDVV